MRENDGQETVWVSPDNSVDTGWSTEQSGFDSQQQDVFLLFKASRPTLGFTQPLKQSIPDVASLGRRGERQSQVDQWEVFSRKVSVFSPDLSSFHMMLQQHIFYFLCVYLRINLFTSAI
jgi:hypothetical protein